MSVEAEVIAILAAQAGRDPGGVTPDLSVEDLGLDSLGLVEAIFAIEERFGIAIPVAPGTAAPATVGDLVAEVARLTDPRAA